MTRGIPESSHMGEEGLDVAGVKGLEEGMSIISILVTTEDLTRTDFNTDNRAFTEPTRKGPCNEKVQKGCKGAALTGASCIGVLFRDVAIDDSTSCSRREKKAGPADEARGGSNSGHNSV